jgi:hypothetical protein
MIISIAMAIDCSRLSGRISFAANSNSLLLDLPKNEKLKKQQKMMAKLFFYKCGGSSGGWNGGE